MRQKVRERSVCLRVQSAIADLIGTGRGGIFHRTGRPPPRLPGIQRLHAVVLEGRIPALDR